jgi:hypothetical protein
LGRDGTPLVWIGTEVALQPKQGSALKQQQKSVMGRVPVGADQDSTWNEFSGDISAR